MQRYETTLQGRITFVIAVLALSTAVSHAWCDPVHAQEKVQLAAPAQPPAITEYAITYFGIDVENQRLRIELKANTGAMKSIIYRNSEPVTNADGTVTPSDNKATNLIRALNKADLTVKSLERRIFEQLVADGHLAGLVVGTPRRPAPEEASIAWRNPDDARRIGQSLLRGGTH